jgi:hypothetical protein
MPRDEHSIFAFGMPSFQESKEAFLGITPKLKVSNPDNEKEENKMPPKEKKDKPIKKNSQVVKNYIINLLTKAD